MVEFALTIMILLILILGPLEVGRAIMVHTSMANAVREGARRGVALYPATGWDTDAATRARSLTSFTDPARLTVTVSTEVAGSDIFVKVDESYIFQSVAPSLLGLSSEFTLTSGSRMLARRG